MSYDWTEFLTLAETLQSDPDSLGLREASLRSAISRAYYATFCIARNFGRDRGEFTPTGTGRDHTLVRTHFELSSNRTRRKIGVDINRMRDNRNTADYDDVLIGRPESLAQSSIDIARNVLNALNSL